MYKLFVSPIIFQDKDFAFDDQTIFTFIFLSNKKVTKQKSRNDYARNISWLFCYV